MVIVGEMKNPMLRLFDVKNTLAQGFANEGFRSRLVPYYSFVYRPWAASECAS